MTPADCLLAAAESRDEDVACRAVLLLWKRLREPGREAETATSFAAMSSRSWRRFGLLLFSSNLDIVRAVVGILTTLVALSRGERGQTVNGDDSWRQAIHQRVWQSEWRQCVLDKLIDCHTQAMVEDGKTTVNAEIALRLVVSLRALFFSALRLKIAREKDQVRLIDLLIDLSQSSLDHIACAALEILKNLLSEACCDGTDGTLISGNARAYLFGSQLFSETVSWLHGLLRSGQLVQRVRQHTLASQRCLLALDMVVQAARQSTDVAISVGQRSDTLLELSLGLIELTDTHASIAHPLQDGAIALLAGVLYHDAKVSTELAGLVRLSGALISISWLLGHTSAVTRGVAGEIFRCILQQSSSRDLVRALLEQGCVVIAFISLAGEDALSKKEATPSRELLRWVMSQLECQSDQFVHSMVSSLERSTNIKLQRNVLLSLLLLAQMRGVVRGALCGEDSNFHGGVFTKVMSESTGSDLAASLIATELLCLDKSSTLKVAIPSSTSLRRKSLQGSSSTPSPPPPAETAPRQLVFALVGGDSVVVVPAEVLPHCKRVLGDTATTFDLRNHEAATLHVLLRLLPLSPQRAVLELKQLDPHRLESLLVLAKSLDCAKCWHAASLAFSATLETSTWSAALDTAQRVRHPALMHRAIRRILESCTVAKPTGTDSSPRPVHGAAIAMWAELHPPLARSMATCSL